MTTTQTHREEIKARIEAAHKAEAPIGLIRGIAQLTGYDLCLEDMADVVEAARKLCFGDDFGQHEGSCHVVSGHCTCYLAGLHAALLRHGKGGVK